MQERYCLFNTFFCDLFWILAFFSLELSFGISKFEFLRSKRVWGQILAQVRQHVDGFVAIC